MHRLTNSPINKAQLQNQKFLPYDNNVKISRSCDYCKLKKVKCGQTKPNCNYCIKHNESCVYSKTRKPGIKPGYGQHVLDKLENIETTLRTESSTTRNEMNLFKQKILELEQKIVTLESKKDFTDTFGTQRIGSNKERLSNGNDSTDNESVRITNAPGKEGIADVKNANTFVDPRSFPTVEQTEKLIEIFFDKVHPIFPILYPVSTIPKLLASMTGSPEPQLYGVILCALRFANEMLQEEEIMKYYSYCKSKIISNFIGLGSIEELQAMSLLAFDLFGKSNNPETWSVISMISSGAIHLNLTKDNDYQYNSYGISKPCRSQGNKCFSIRNISTTHDPTAWLDKESRRNLFWEIYILDKLSSLSNSFPFKIPENEINCLLPARLDLWISGNREGSAGLINLVQDRKLAIVNDHIIASDIYDSNCFLIEVMHILGEVHSFMRQSLDVHNEEDVSAWQVKFNQLEQKVSTWRKTIPKSFIDLLDNNNCLFKNTFTVKDVLFHALYHTMIIRLNSTPGFPYFSSEYFPPSELARSKCLGSASHIVKLSRQFPLMFNNTGGDIYEMCGPQYAFAVWVSARLIFVNAVNTHVDIPPELDYLVGLLTKMGSRWEGSLRYANILKFLKDETLLAKKNGSSFYGRTKNLQANVDTYNDTDNDDLNEDVKDHSKNVRIISDMRLNAYSLDVLLYNKIEKFKQNENEAASESNENDFMDMFEWFKFPETNFGNNTNTLITSNMTP